MKVKVLRNLVDAVTREPFKKGDFMDLPQKRAEDAQALGLVQIIETEKKETKPKRAKKEKK